MNLKINKILKSVFILVIFALAVKVGAVWVAPSSSAPGGNTLPPLNTGTFTQYKNGNFTAKGLKATNATILEGLLQIPGGVPPLTGKVLTSDATGMASWQTPTGGSGGGVGVGGDGSGTVNYLTKWDTATSIVDSQIFDNGTNLGIGTSTPSQKFDVNGNVKATQFCLPGTNPTGGCIGVWPSGNGGDNGWTRDSTGVVRLTNSTDKVGVGTSLPTGQLELSGNFKMPETIGYPSQIGAIKSKTGIEVSDVFIHNNGTMNTYLGYRSGCTNLILCAGKTGDTAIGRYHFDTYNNAVRLGNSGSTSDNGVMAGEGAGTTSSGDDTTIGSNSLRNFYQPGYHYTDPYIGHRNAVLGYKAMYTFTFNGVSVDNNVSLGANSMSEYYYGSDNIAIGYNAASGSGSLSNATVIGSQSTISASNTMVFGNGAVDNWGFGTQPGGDAIKVSNGARLTMGGDWTDASDRNKKYDISNMHYGLSDVLKLHPVDYKLKINNQQSVGFIAQEVKEVIPELVYGEEGDMTMSYGQMTAVLAKSLQELKEENDQLKYETSLLEKELE